MAEDLSKIRHVEAEDPLAATVTSQPTRAIELRLKQLEALIQNQSSTAANSRLIIPNVRIASTVQQYNTVYFNPNTDQYEQGLAGVTVKADTFTLNPSAVAIGILVAKKSATVGDVMVGGYDSLDSSKLTALLETGEVFLPGVPLYLSARQLGKLTRFPPNFKVQVVLTSDDHYILQPVYADPDAVEVTYRNQVGMRPVGAIRAVPLENLRYQIVGFDGLENYNTIDDTKWRVTGSSSSAVDTHKKFGYMVADAVVVKQPATPVFIKIEVARTTGVISVAIAQSFEEIESDPYFTTTLGAPNNLSNVTRNTHRALVVPDRAGSTIGTLTFKFTNGDVALARRVYFKFPDSFQGWKMLSDPSPVTAVATIGVGNVTDTVIVDPGSGYTSATAQFSGGGGTGAAATVTLDGGEVVAVTITNSGTGYTSAPAIAILGDGSGASVNALINGVVSVEVTHGSFGYSTPPTVVFTGGAGSGATAVANINDSGIVTSIDVTFSGSNYTSAPTVSFTGIVTDLTVVSPGEGYLSAPTVSIDPPDVGVQATATVDFSGVKLLKVDRVAGGNNYTSDPAARVTSEDGGYDSILRAEISTNSVIEIPVTSPGVSYDTPPLVSFKGGTGCATGTVTISSGAVTGVPITQPGKGYTSPPTLVFTDSTGTGAAATATLKAIEAKVMNGGGGYVVSDSITLAGGTNSVACVIDVLTVTNANGIVGEIATVSISTPGVYTVIPTGQVGQAATTGIGTGADFKMFWGIAAATVTAPGTGYTGPVALSFRDGGQVRATAILDAANTVDRFVINNGGGHFLSAPTVQLTGGDPVTPAVAGTPVIDGAGLASIFTVIDPGEGFGSLGTSAVDRIVVVDGGSGYATPPVVSFIGDDGSGATATAAVSGGKLTGITVTNSGDSYKTPPQVILTGGGGSNAVAVAYLKRQVGLSGGGQAVSGNTTISTGQVTAVNVTNGGSGYAASFAVTFTGGGGSGATATATASGGVVTSVNILTAGSGYTSAPTAVFTAGGGSAAAATVTIANGGVVLGNVTASPAGTGYTHQPVPVFTSGPGSGAEATATVGSGLITAITVDEGGHRYLTPPKVIITGGGGTGGVATAALTNGAVSSVTVTNAGTGYSSAPTITFSMGSGAKGETRLKVVGTPVIAGAGIGYAVNDTITIDDGQFDTAAILQVATIGMGGTITSVTISNAGSYKVVPRNPATQSATSGAGSGASFTLDYGVEKTIVTVAGTNYPVAPVISFDGGGNGEAYFEAGGTVLDLTINNPGSGYTTAPLVSFTGGGGTGATAIATISGAGGQRHDSSLQIRSYNDDYDDSPTLEFPAPLDTAFFFNLLADPVMKSRWPSVPVEKTTFLLNGLETLTGKLNEGRAEFDEMDCDVGLSRKTFYWTTSHVDACPWDRYYEQYRLEPGTSGRDNILPETGDDTLDTNFRYWEHTFKYEPNRNKGWVYINRLSRYHQSGRVVSLAVESPLQLVSLEDGHDSRGATMTGQLLLRLNNQANILSPPSPQIDMTTNGTTVAIYQNLTGRNVMISSVILETIFQLTSAGTVVPDNNARVTVGTQAGNFRNLIGNLDANAVIQVGRDTRLIDQNQYKELFVDEDFAYSVIAPNEIVYLKVDEAAGGPIASQLAVARVKGHIL